MSTQKPVIAAFDFDCTITTTDSFRLFFKFLLGSRRYYTMLLRHFWPLAGYALGIVSNERAKGILLRGFLRGMTLDDFERHCRDYAASHHHIVRPEAEEAIARHLLQGHQVVVITASIKQWVEPMVDSRVAVLATELEVDDNGVITGNLATPNCYGLQKVERLRQWAARPLKDYHIIAYGDSRGDKELLFIANEKHYREL